MIEGTLARLTAAVAVGLLVFAVIGASGCGGSSDEAAKGGKAGTGELVINSYGGAWGDGIQLGLIEPFERETGIKVKLLATSDAAKSRLAIQSGNKPPEDLIDTTHAETIPVAKAGLLEPLPYSKWDKATVSQLPAHAKYEYSVAALGFAEGLCFDKRKFPDGKPQPKNWADFWNVKKFPGRRGMRSWVTDGPEPEVALLADGVAREDLYPIDQKRAFAKLDELKPHVRWYETPPEVGQALIDGSVSMATCYTHRFYALIDGGADFIGVSFDQARTAYDDFAVWKNAPNKENALKFLEFALRKENQARWARIGLTAPINPEAGRELPKEAAERIATSAENLPKTFSHNENYYAKQQDGTTNWARLQKQWQEWVRS